jgi:hypothetical protein
LAAFAQGNTKGAGDRPLAVSLGVALCLKAAALLVLYLAFFAPAALPSEPASVAVFGPAAR